MQPAEPQEFVPNDGTYSINDLVAFVAPYNAYPHQLESFCRAVQENTIIILPTGTGKTLIAAMLIDFYSSASSLTLFVVNNVALVEQQTKYLRKVCQSPWASVVAAHDAWQVEAGGIIVGTAGSILGILPDLQLDRLAVVVFDEVHHATGDHPYIQLLRLLGANCVVQPRILGLTASWLHGELRDLEMKRHSLQTAVEATIYVPKIAEDHKSKAKFTRVSYPDERPELSSSMQVAAWIVSVAESLHPELTTAFSSQSKKATAVEIGLGSAGLSVFPHALCEIINAQLHSKIAHVEDQEAVESTKQGLAELPHATALLQVDADFAPVVLGSPSAKAKVLMDLLASRTGRTLVFVEQVCFVLPLAAMLSTYLQEPVMHVSGAQSMLREARDRNISAFRSGESRILVATAALEEGLDVPDCDCVVRYDSFANVKSHLQGSGRARMLGSEIFYFDNSPDEEDQRTATMMGANVHLSNGDCGGSTAKAGTGEGHQWGPESTIWDTKENKSFRGQSCALCGASLRITSRSYGQGGKKKERQYAVEGSFICPGHVVPVESHASEQGSSFDMAGATHGNSNGEEVAIQGSCGEGHCWGPEDTIWDVRENKSFTGHCCSVCGANLRISVRAYGRARKKKERTYTLDGPTVCPGGQLEYDVSLMQ